MADDTPSLVNAHYLLRRFPGKGGWTYAEIPEIAQNPANPFGWVQVKGSIDGFELKQYKLMPMGEGRLFLPVRAEIRKKIRKQAGDTVHVILYADDSSVEIPGEILECFDNEPPELLERFRTLADGQQKAFIDWIYKAKTEDTKAQRIVEMMDKLTLGLGFYDKM